MTDMTKGVYRKVYSGFLRGRRITLVTLQAEAWFWRINMLADDFGNLAADPEVLAADLGGRRKVSVAKSEALIAQLLDAKLLIAYEIGGERYLSIVGFQIFQKSRNGRPIQRVQPPSINTSRGIQKNRGNACSEAEADTNADTKPSPGEPNPAPRPPTPQASPPPPGPVGSIADTSARLARLGINSEVADRLAAKGVTVPRAEVVIAECRKPGSGANTPLKAAVGILKRECGIGKSGRNGHVPLAPAADKFTEQLRILRDRASALKSGDPPDPKREVARAAQVERARRAAGITPHRPSG